MRIFLRLTILFIFPFLTQGQQVNDYAFNEGVENHFYVFGEGEEVMLVINGGPGMNSNGFQSLARDFAKRYQIRIVLYDQRGTGESSMESLTPDKLTLDLMISDIEAIRSKMGISEWAVFGQSFGGMLASYYATKKPTSILGIILSSSGGLSLNDLSQVNIFGRLTEAELDSFRYWDRQLNVAPDNVDLRYRRGLFLAPAYVVDKKHVPVITKRLTQANMTINQLILQDMRSIDFDCKAGLTDFSKPVTIVNGELDIVSNQVAENTHKLLKNSELYIINKSSHYGWLDNPKDYFAAIDSFMSRIGFLF